jgi:hypothetical protein
MAADRGPIPLEKTIAVREMKNHPVENALVAVLRVIRIDDISKQCDGCIPPGRLQGIKGRVGCQTKRS